MWGFERLKPRPTRDSAMTAFFSLVFRQTVLYFLTAPYLTKRLSLLGHLTVTSTGEKR